MKIAIFGATGIVGKAVVEEALEKGYEVTVLTRDAHKVTSRHANLHIVEGDVTDAAVVRSVVEGQDAVIQTLGIGGKGNGKPTTFVSEANRLIMKQMKAAGVTRLVAVSVIGAGDSRNFLPGIYRAVVMPLCMRWFMAIIDDKNRMEASIAGSGLRWTVVRCTTVKQRRPTGHVVASYDGKGLKFSISAADMAAFMVGTLRDDRYIGRIPTISN